MSYTSARETQLLPIPLLYLCGQMRTSGLGRACGHAGHTKTKAATVVAAPKSLFRIIDHQLSYTTLMLGMEMEIFIVGSKLLK